MEHEVLIGTVKNIEQFNVNYNEKFYHMPEAVIPKNMLPVKFIALYFPYGTFGDKNGCIKYYGKVKEMKLIKRAEITSLPSKNPEMMYYKFEIEEWLELKKPIIREVGGVYTKAFTSLDKLLSAENLSDIVNNERAKAKKIKDCGFSQKDLEKIEISKDPVGVKIIARRANKVAGIEKVTAVQITKYLLEKGYLKTETDEKTNTENRVPTELGAGLGIENFWEINKYYREYSKNYYGELAQRFIIAHLNDIVVIPMDEAYRNK